MKVTVNVDCTPQEARVFFGLPDVEPMQKAVMDKLQAQMEANIAAMDVETMMKTWLPASIQGFDEIRKAFWNAATGAATSAKK